MKIKKNNKRNRKTVNSGVAQLSKQLFEKDLYVLDIGFSLPDSGNTGYDLFSVIATGTDFTNNALSYGEYSWIAAEFNFMPYFQYSSLITDQAIGAFGTRQGVFDVTVTAKTFLNVLREPGAFLVTNKKPWSFKMPITQRRYISTSETQTITSDVPKVNFYVAYSVLATTNINLGEIHVRALVKYRAKLD